MKRFLINIITLLIITRILPGFDIDSWVNAIIAVIVISIINFTVKPILVFLTLPVTLITLGIFYFILNALLLQFAAAITPGFKIDNFLTALLASLLYSLISSFLVKILNQQN